MYIVVAMRIKIIIPHPLYFRTSEDSDIQFDPNSFIQTMQKMFGKFKRVHAHLSIYFCEENIKNYNENRTLNLHRNPLVFS